ncbi:MAG: rRNA pseudouridine synthase [Sphingomonas sp.]|nr:rRNA pseudouridine synthase [Sphingomonas sp.]
MSPEKPNKSPRDNSHPASRDADGQRIAKLLARAGVASRREIERMIAEGRVAIDGQAIDTPATILRSLKGVTVDGNPVEAAAPARLFLYHKPSGVLVTERDPNGRPTIYDRLPKDLPRLVPVGRLDLNTEGLLLLTTDGELKRQLELPATGVERAYRARAYGTVTQAQLEDLIEGVEIEGVRYGSIDANLERRTGANVWIEMILTEGKNREVRRVLEYLGLKVSRLIRTRYGPFILADLPVGGIGEVRQHDIVAFRKDPRRMPPAEPAKFRESRGRDAAADRAGAHSRNVGRRVFLLGHHYRPGQGIRS